MVHMTAEQLRAMFSKEELSRGISSQDIAMRKAQFVKQGLLPPETKREFIEREKRFKPAGSPREEFYKSGEVIVIPRKEIPQEMRDITLPTRFKVIKYGEKKGETVRKKTFGPLNPEEQASEAQIQALQKMTGKDIEKLTKKEAFDKFQIANRQRSMQIVVGLEGGRVDPSVESVLQRFTPMEKLEAREQLQRLASRKGKASPLELSSSDINFVLQRVKPR